MNGDDDKKIQINLPGTTLFLDWRYMRVLVVYRALCLVLDTVSLLINIYKALVCSIYRFFVPNDLKDLNGSLALVTGSGHGIGMELCVRLGKLGARVICLDIDEEGNKKTEERLKKIGCTYYMFRCDVSNKHDVDTVAANIIHQIGVPTLLINNAAITKRKSFLEHSQGELERLFSINIVGPMFIIQKFLPHMLKNPHLDHQIVAISSIVGMLGTPNMVPYSATKFALTGFMEGLHYELMADKVSNISLTTVHPFLVSSSPLTKPNLRYQGLIGIVTVKEAVEKILQGIRREEREVYVPASLYFLTRLLRIIPRAAQTKLLEFVEFGSGP